MTPPVSGGSRVNPDATISFNPDATISFTEAGPDGASDAVLKGKKLWEPFGTLSIPREPVETRLFKGTGIDGGPRLSLTMHVGEGRMAPMNAEAQEIYFRAVADAALSCMSEEQCKKIIGFVPFKNGIRFEVSTGKRAPAWEPVWVDFQPPWASEPRENDPLIDEDEGDWTSNWEQDLENGPESSLASWLREGSYSPEKGLIKDEVVLDLRPRRKYGDHEEKEPRASAGVKRLLYLLMLAHEGVSDGFRTKRPLATLKTQDIEGVMDDFFGDGSIAEAKK